MVKNEVNKPYELGFRYPSQVNTFSMLVLNSRAVLNALSRVSESRSASIAATVWRVTPIALPSSA